jgi:trafficking protein particle complex subunit 1
MVVYSFYIFDRHSEFSRSTCAVKANHIVAECIYSKLWARQDQPTSSSGTTKNARPTSDSSLASNSVQTNLGPARARPARLSAQDDAKLIFGTIFSLRNMVRKLGGTDDRSVPRHKIPLHLGRIANYCHSGSFISYRTGQYKLHYYETATNIKFVMLTDTQTPNMRNVLHQIYVNLYVEFGKYIHSYSWTCG